MNDSKDKKAIKPVTLADGIVEVRKFWQYLLGKWVTILMVGLTGGLIGLGVSFFIKPKYTAHLSFALVEKSSSAGGLADLASSFGFAGLTGGTNGAFSGDNLLEIIQSRNAIEKTLLTPVNYKGKVQNLVEVYIEFSGLRKEWSENGKLKELSYPVNLERTKFTRIQDSVLSIIYTKISSPKVLKVIRKDKKLSFVNLDFVSNDELFSKLFIETLMNQTYLFYKETKTSQSRANLKMIQHTADSIKVLYEKALYRGAGFSQVNINQALQFAAVPRIKQENDAQLYGTVYAEVLKNLETLKLDMFRETPIVQIIDSPILPLKVDRIGKLKTIVLGVLLSELALICLLLAHSYIRNMLSENK